MKKMLITLVIMTLILSLPSVALAKNNSNSQKKETKNEQKEIKQQEQQEKKDTKQQEKMQKMLERRINTFNNAINALTKHIDRLREIALLCQENGQDVSSVLSKLDLAEQKTDEILQAESGVQQDLEEVAEGTEGTIDNQEIQEIKKDGLAVGKKLKEARNLVKAAAAELHDIVSSVIEDGVEEPEEDITDELEEPETEDPIE